jgi:addiction module HigA family antidote
MMTLLTALKGTHPGKIIGHELAKRRIRQNAFAHTLGIHPQQLNAIVAGRRRLSPELSLRIERELQLEEGFLYLLQGLHELHITKEKAPSFSEKRPDSSRFRRALFWDTAIERIDWQRQRKAVLQRVAQYGTAEERTYFEEFYA